MLKKVKAAVKKAKEALPPPTAKSLDEVIDLFRRKGVVSVTAEATLYQKLLAGHHKIVIDYTGVRGKLLVRRQEVLKVITEKVTNDQLVKEMRKLYPLIREKVEKLRIELGVAVTIPEHIVKVLTVPSLSATRQSSTNA